MTSAIGLKRHSGETMSIAGSPFTLSPKARQSTQAFSCFEPVTSHRRHIIASSGHNWPAFKNGNFDPQPRWSWHWGCLFHLSQKNSALAERSGIRLAYVHKQKL